MSAVNAVFGTVCGLGIPLLILNMDTALAPLSYLSNGGQSPGYYLVALCVLLACCLTVFMHLTELCRARQLLSRICLQQTKGSLS
jgi:hypothetical protein